MVERSITCAHSSLGSLTFYQKLGQQQCKLGARMCLAPAAGQFIEQTVNTLRQLLRCCSCRGCWFHGGCGFGNLWQHRYGGTTNSKAKCCNFQIEICAQQHVVESAGMVLCPAWLLATSKSHRLHSLWFQFLWRLIGWHLSSRSHSPSLFFLPVVRGRSACGQGRGERGQWCGSSHWDIECVRSLSRAGAEY